MNSDEAATLRVFVSDLQATNKTLEARVHSLTQNALAGEYKRSTYISVQNVYDRAQTSSVYWCLRNVMCNHVSNVCATNKTLKVRVHSLTQNAHVGEHFNLNNFSEYMTL